MPKSYEQEEYDILKISANGSSKGLTISLKTLSKYLDVSPGDCLLLMRNPDGSARLQAFNPLKEIFRHGAEITVPTPESSDPDTEERGDF